MLRDLGVTGNLHENIQQRYESSNTQVSFSVCLSYFDYYAYCRAGLLRVLCLEHVKSGYRLLPLTCVPSSCYNVTLPPRYTCTYRAEARKRKKYAARAAQAARGPQRWARVHPGCTLVQVLGCEGYVVAGVTPTLTVYPRSSQAHADFLRDNEARVVDLAP